jgi:E3 ubiquitin-protein ligase EDD1
LLSQVDGAHALVQCQNKDGSEGLSVGKSDTTSLLSDCRILRKDDLQVVKGLSAPKVPDCFQKTPKKIMVPENGQILATAVDTQGENV